MRAADLRGILPRDVAEGHDERRETELHENRAATADQFPGSTWRQETRGDGQLLARGGFFVHLFVFPFSKVEYLSSTRSRMHVVTPCIIFK